MSLVIRRTPSGTFVPEDKPVGSPASGEVRIRHTAMGVNFIDAYFRQGLYPLPPPHIPGVEAVGIVEAIGPDVGGFVEGDRVAYAGYPVGAWTECRVAPASRLFRVPDWLSDRDAAAVLLKGLTAHMLLFATYKVNASSLILVHSAAGGLGQILTRWAKALGATVAGTVSSAEKAALVEAQGADLVMIGRNADWPSMLQHTFGRLADVAYDGIGADTLLRTMQCVRAFGTVASIGQAGGPITPFSIDEIGPRRSLCLARPSVMAYAADAKLYSLGIDALLDAMRNGWRANIGAVFPLAEAAAALAALEHGQTTGSVLLTPHNRSDRDVA